MDQNTSTTSEEKGSHSKLVTASIIVAIVIVMNLFFNYAISLIYQEPVYGDFIDTQQIVEPITTKDACLSVGGQWNGGSVEVIPPADQMKSAPTYTNGYCDPNYTNQKKYDAAREKYERGVFITLVVLGVASLLVGAFVSISILSLAFSWGGVLSLLIASMRYWSVADNLLKVIILGVALGMLIWLAVKKFAK